MRTRWFFIGLLVLIFAACHRPVETVHAPSPHLNVIDSLVWQQPDSALTLLLAFAESPDADSLDEFNGHYFQLLVSELLYKNDYEQSNREELLEAVDYFDSIGDAFLDARAHYIKGVGFYERDSVVDACAEYLRALEVMEGHFEEDAMFGHKAMFMFFTYNRLLELFSSQFMMDPAIDCGEHALDYCRKEPSLFKEIPNTYFHIGRQYDKKEEIVVASNYYWRAIEGFADKNSPIYRDAISMKALCDYQMGMEAEQSINTIKQTLLDEEGDKEWMSRYMAIGAIFLKEGVYDSAMYYLEPVFENETDVVVRIRVAESLRVINDSLGNCEKSNECVLFLADHKKPEGENKALVSRLNDLFHDYLMEEQQKLSEAERKKSAKKAVGMVVPIGLIVAFALVVLVRNRSKKLHQKDMEAERQSHKLQQDALSGRLKKSNRELKELKSQLTQETEVVAKTEPAVSFFDEPVCRLILERVKEGRFKAQMDCEVYKSYAMDKVQVIALREAVDRHFGGFCARLKRTYPELTYSDLDYCCLYLLGLNDADVSALMQKAYTTISQRSRKIKTILGNKQQLSATLRSLAGSDLLC